MDKHKIILNDMLSEELSVLPSSSAILKNYFNTNKFLSIIIYWNLKLAELQNSFIWNNNANIRKDDESRLLLFFNYLAIKRRDHKAYVNIKGTLMSIKPNHTTSEVAFFDKHMQLYAQKLDEIIDEYIDEVYSDEIVCFMFFVDKEYKWISASIIADKIKEKYADSQIIIGGINHKDTAVSYLQNFNQFDFAIWGEVEKTMLDLCNYLLEGRHTYEDIPCLSFRRNNDIVFTFSGKKENTILLTDPALKPDYSDFFNRKENAVIPLVESPVISIETNRKFRNKPVPVIIDEIAYFINHFQIYAFHFSCCEAMCNNRYEFERLLDALIQVKETFPNFSVSLVELLAATITPVDMRKMMMAGFYSIRTDYTSASENLLKKSGAKSSFANHLLLIKLACFYHIILADADILMGMPEETDEDILQSISNLYYLRFFFTGGLFKHRMKKAEVMRHSKRYRQMRKHRGNWDINPFLRRFLPADYLHSDDRDMNIVRFMPIQVNPLWDDFKRTELYFIQNRFEYKLYRKADDSVLYKELFNNNVVGEFELDAMDWFILETANSQVIHIEYLLGEIRSRIKREFMEIEIINILENLKSERLLYISDDYKEILSIINTELVV